MIDFESQLKEDEQLATALQESLSIGQQPIHSIPPPSVPPPSIPPRSAYENGHFSQPIHVPFSTGYRYRPITEIICELALLILALMAESLSTEVSLFSVFIQ